MRKTVAPQFVVCVDNKGYAGSLEVRKLYQLIADTDAAEHNQIRVIDESGEDYLYGADRFIPVELSREESRAVLKAS